MGRGEGQQVGLQPERRGEQEEDVKKEATCIQASLIARIQSSFSSSLISSAELQIVSSLTFGSKLKRRRRLANLDQRLISIRGVSVI